MDKEQVLSAIATSLATISHPRYYETERGFQGELYAELRQRLEDLVVPEGCQLEQEYQKRLGSHGLTIRPDIIIHEPFDEARHEGRDVGNYAVIELKLNAGKGEAEIDMANIVRMIDVLKYRLGVFININGERTWAELVPEAYRPRIVCFAVTLDEKGSTRVLRA